MNAGHFSRNLLQDLAAPFLAHGDRIDRRDGFGTTGSPHVDDAQIRSLLGPEPEEHRLRFLAVTRLLIESDMVSDCPTTGFGGQAGEVFRIRKLTILKGCLIKSTKEGSKCRGARGEL